MSTATRTQSSKPIIDVQLPDVLKSLKTEIMRSMNCVKIGQIQLFDATKKTAQVQLLFKRVIQDNTSPTGQSIKDYPVLVDCPVFTLQGGGGAIQFPIAAGDQCIVLFADRNIDAWFQNGSAAAPFDARCHDLSDGICLVGINSLASTLSAYDPAKLRIFYDGAEIDLASGSVIFRSATSNSEIDLGAATAGIKNGSGGQVTISAASLVKIANNTTTLLTLLDGLIDVIAAATVQTSGTPPLTAVTIAALQAYKLQLATLLQ